MSMSFQTFIYKDVAIQASYSGTDESYCVTMSHGTRAFPTIEKAQRYIRKQQEVS